MRIEQAILRNYRQFKEAVVSFGRKPGGDLHVIIGTNGAGKTNILNGINWCLYGDEPHLSKRSQSLPLLNLETIQEVDDEAEKDVEVEIWAETEDGRYVIFTRKATYQIYDGDTPIHQGTDFEVKTLDDKGNTKILEGENAGLYVERFVPQRIREFFFFDGERLDRYFREATAQNIRHAVFQISQLDLLEHTIERKLKITLNDLVSEAGKDDPDIDQTQADLKQAEDDLAQIERRIQECESQIADANAAIEESQENLRGVPDIEKLEEEREELLEQQKAKSALLQEKIAERQSLLFQYGKILMLYEAIIRSTRMIQDKEAEHEIPPTVDRGLIEKILQEQVCSICGRALDADCESHVEELLKEISLSTEVARQLVEMQGYLQRFRDSLESFEKDVRKVSRELELAKDDLSRIERRRDTIDQEIGGYDKGKVKGWHRKRRNMEQVLRQNLQTLGVFKQMELPRVEKRIAELQEQLDRELSKKAKLQALKKQIDFCRKALDVVRKTRDAIMKETRLGIEEETRRLFFDPLLLGKLHMISRMV